ncbi:hypothetical protein AB4454_05960 [Vibrio artabrorum]|uniref:hypothetical protein n=1 Tax=Vibrio artabrorum TaxID=446374 RepID=UPI0035535998
MNDDKVIELLEKISEWLQKRPSKGVRNNDREGVMILRLLKRLSTELHKVLPDDLKEHYRPQYSRGKSSLPRILWVSLCPKRRAVHNSMSVTICFSTSDNGFVFGIVDSVTMPQRWLPIVKREKGDITVNVDAVNYKYNNAFHNPKEMELDSIDIDVLRSHLVESSSILHQEILTRFPIIHVN